MLLNIFCFYCYQIIITFPFKFCINLHYSIFISFPLISVSTVAPVDGHWSEWSTWEECSAPCGGGIQVRRRRCNSPPPQHGGRECIGCTQDYKFCNLQTCPEVKKASPWTPYLRVNQTREGYFEQRFKFVCRANVCDENLLRVGHMKKEERFCPEGGRNCLDSGMNNLLLFIRMISDKFSCKCNTVFIIAYCMLI